MNRKARRTAERQGRDTAAPSGLAQSHRRIARPAEAAGVQVELGNRHFAQGRLDQALNCYVQAIELQPDHMAAHNNFGAVLLAQGQFDAVAAHFEQILAIKPDTIDGYNTLAMALLGAGNAARALDTVIRALKISETPESRSLFVISLQNLQAIPPSNDIRDLVVRAISEPWGRPNELSRHGVALIKVDADIARGIEQAVAAWPSRLSVDQLSTSLPAAFRNPVLRCLLENTRTDDVGLERYLTSVRLALLEAAVSAEAVNDDILGFYCALARQCFINEYVYARSDPEYARFESLRRSLAEALASNAQVPPLWLVAVAAYAPLHRVPDIEKMLGRTWPDCVAALLRQQVREPTEELRLRDNIPLLTPIDDRVSLLVQEQYEENPYPRWVKAAPVHRVAAMNARLRGQFPLAKFNTLEPAGAVDVLIAGCGTGQQLVDEAQRIAHARVLAIDLSRASLCYAKRQTEALGLRNIEYGQADILRLGALGRSFDVIECGGVLHHLGDPLAGWRVLLSLLRPNGVMRVALYSELARQHVVAARALVAERSYGRTAEDIRRFRQDVLALPDGDPVKLLAQSPDFFSVSDCRDLVFHVQEHRFTLPQIKAFLAPNGLEFLGFEIEPAVLTRYSARFPDDRARTDLDRWHTFEQQHLWTFGGMYQFWVQKAG